MKVLVFEYICGGGLRHQALSPALLAEGRLMLQALLYQLKRLPALQLAVPLDPRCSADIDCTGLQRLTLLPEQPLMAQLSHWLADCDAFWPIAPESDGVLSALVDLAQQRQKIVLASSSQAIALCGNKWHCYQQLRQHGIATVDTQPLQPATLPLHWPCIIKPADGVGCQSTWRLSSPDDWLDAMQQRDDPSGFIVQPYIEGTARSLSCLFKAERGWLLCCNQQLMQVHDRQLALHGIIVNQASALQGYYLELVQQLAAAMPGLWGYVGIDVIEPTADAPPLVLDINPRLTSSFVAIEQATGIVVAEQVMALLSGEPNLPTHPLNHSITLSLR